MIDPDEMTAFEDWKAKKLMGQVDLSISAFNLEQESQALAYEAGVKDVFSELGEDGAAKAGIATLDEFLTTSPYRKPGMKGQKPVRITS